MADELVTKSGFIDLDSRNPLLEEEDGPVWRLEGEVAMEILLGSDVVLTAVQTDAKTLEVRTFGVQDEEDYTRATPSSVRARSPAPHLRR